MSTVLDREDLAEQSAASHNLAWLLSQAGHALVTQQQARLEALGITPRGYCVMATAATGSFSQTEIAREIGLDKTTMVVTIDALEAAGLVERLPSPTDRRARVIALTAAGREKTAEGATLVAQVEDEVLQALPAAQREVLVSALDTLVTGPLESPAACSGKPPRRRT